MTGPAWLGLAVVTMGWPITLLSAVQLESDAEATALKHRPLYRLARFLFVSLFMWTLFWIPVSIAAFAAASAISATTEWRP